MALQVFTDLMALLWKHPVLSGLVLVLFTPPFFPIVKFFSPLLICTALFMLALFTVGRPEATSNSNGTNVDNNSNQTSQEENWEFRRAPDVKVWEDKSLFTPLRKNSGESGSWLDRFQSIVESGYAWVEAKLQNDNWKGNSLNDDNVSILQEATWAPTPKPGDKHYVSSSSVRDETSDITPIAEDIDARVPSAVSPTRIFKVNSKLEAEHLANAKLTSDAEDLGGVAPSQLQSLKHASSMHHKPLASVQIPLKSATNAFDSPSTDLDDASDLDRSKRFLRRNSVNTSSGHSKSDVDTPAADALTTSGRLKQIESLADLIEEREHHIEPTDQEMELLRPTNAEQLEAVKEKLEEFTHSPERQRSKAVTTSKAGASSPLFKEGKSGKRKSFAAKGDDSSSSGEELSDSESDSEFEIFPPVDPAKMKLHPPVKLDIEELEKKLGTSLSRGATPPKGEITEVQ